MVLEELSTEAPGCQKFRNTGTYLAPRERYTISQFPEPEINAQTHDFHEENQIRRARSRALETTSALDSFSKIMLLRWR